MVRPLPVLHAILDVDVAQRAGWAPLDLAHAFMRGGARFIQIRAKHLASGPFLDLCDAVVRAAAPFETTVIVNDRADLARMCGADGVHVGQDDLPAADARALLGPDAIVGVSTHSVAQIEAARTWPVTYIAVGPVHGTQTKETGYSAVGLDLVATAARLGGGRPIVAIGGITLHNVAATVAAGASMVAVISDLLTGGDPEARAREYVQAIARDRV